MQNFYSQYDVEPVRTGKENIDYALYHKTPKLVLQTKNYYNIKNIENVSKLNDKAILALKEQNSELLDEYLSVKEMELVDDSKLATKSLIEQVEGISEEQITAAVTKKANSHYFSIYLASVLKEGATVVTGFVNGVTTKSKNLHSWVETELDGKQFVLDITINGIIEKEAYYAHKNVEVINSVTYEELQEDGKTVYPYLKSRRLSYAAYLCCRQEVLSIISQQETSTC